MRRLLLALAIFATALGGVAAHDTAHAPEAGATPVELFGTGWWDAAGGYMHCNDDDQGASGRRVYCTWSTYDFAYSIPYAIDTWVPSWCPPFSAVGGANNTPWQLLMRDPDTGTPQSCTFHAYSGGSCSTPSGYNGMYSRWNGYTSSWSATCSGVFKTTGYDPYVARLSGIDGGHYSWPGCGPNGSDCTIYHSAFKFQIWA